ncbi:hypothetical protein AVEN_164700-1 [Araneus ventricosus]|uniref:Uncharacterized protein n=1 Tax=Araneus ventricosus TaxID=182803 RepID=A0A4Y2HK11_ARAVE|nr:hypothetical protein AVEN_164700-1 [Araneus ventricosus]
MSFVQRTGNQFPADLTGHVRHKQTRNVHFPQLVHQTGHEPSVVFSDVGFHSVRYTLRPVSETQHGQSFLVTVNLNSPLVLFQRTGRTGGTDPMFGTTSTRGFLGLEAFCRNHFCRRSEKFIVGKGLGKNQNVRHVDKLGT